MVRNFNYSRFRATEDEALKREQQVVKLIGAGVPPRAICERLSITMYTYNKIAYKNGLSAQKGRCYLAAGDP